LLVPGGSETELSWTLSSLGHAVVLSGSDHRSARLLARLDPDVAIVAGPDPARVCRALRSQSPDLPIIAIVSGGDVQERVAALESGADDCIRRPFHRTELGARLDAAVRRRARFSPSSSGTPAGSSGGAA
jgi:DNA-binding response OmpR family regulator